MNVFSGWWPKKPMYLQDASWCQLVKQPCKSCIMDRGWIDKWMDGCFPIFNSQLTWGDFLAMWWAIHILSLDHFGQYQKTPSLTKCNSRIMKPLSFLAPDGKCFISLYYTVCYYIILVVLFHPSWLTPLWIIAKKLLFFKFPLMATSLLDPTVFSGVHCASGESDSQANCSRGGRATGGMSAGQTGKVF